MKSKEMSNLLKSVYTKVKTDTTGSVATYIPELAKADPNLFGIAFVSCDGEIYEEGNSGKSIPIQSVSKVFTLALALETLGVSTVVKKIGNSGSSLPFNSVVAAALSSTHTINPFVNQGAMATTSLLCDKNIQKFRSKVLKNMDNYAGKRLLQKIK